MRRDTERGGVARLSRRGFLRAVSLGGSAAVLAACQAAAPSAPKAAPPAAQPAPPAGSQPAPAAAAKPAPAAWEAQWNALVEAAKQEGTVVVSGPPTPEVRTQLGAAFKNRFGIELEYLGGRTSELMARLKVERAAGQYTVDAMVAGAQSAYTDAYPEKMLARIPPVLIHPDATDPTKWIKGSHWYMDPEQQYILRISNYASLSLTTNTQFVRAEDITGFRDLLKPEYRGKISVYDPIRPGTGWNTANYLLRTLGEDYVKALYQDQQPGVSNDNRVLADWMARGRYPISLGLGTDEIERLRKDGFPIVARRDFADAAGIVTAGFGLVMLLDPAPHPNAAKLFVNWMAMKEGNEVYNRAQVSASTRNDVDNSWAPEYVIPSPGVDYFDTYDWDFTVNSRAPEEIARLQRLTGQQ
jgi:iron(III) transport system substrate-binding protein